MEATLLIEGKRFHVALSEIEGGWSAEVDGVQIPLRIDRDRHGVMAAAGETVHHIHFEGETVLVDGREVQCRVEEVRGVAGIADATAGATGPIRPPMNGVLAEICVETGQSVAAGDVLFVLEAMKMRNEIKAQTDATVAAIEAEVGQPVDPTMTILTLE